MNSKLPLDQISNPDRRFVLKGTAALSVAALLTGPTSPSESAGLSSIDDWIARESIPFASDADLDAAVDQMMAQLGDQVSVLGLGEPLHGGDEFLTLRNRVFKRLVAVTTDAGTVTLTNDTAPEFNRLPEADRADMETFIEQLRIILPLVGFDLFRPRRPVWTAPAAGADNGPIFTFSTGAASARARETEDGFVVLAGSTAKTATSGTFQAGYRALRERLLADGSLVPGSSSELLVFATDVVFASPSAAAAVVAGRSASGPIEWKITETGQAYRDWRAATLE